MQFIIVALMFGRGGFNLSQRLHSLLQTIETLLPTVMTDSQKPALMGRAGLGLLVQGAAHCPMEKITVTIGRVCVDKTCPYGFTSHIVPNPSDSDHDYESHSARFQT